jgi:hypothetical protein
MASYFRIRNFERFQHYKDRNPPWIRLHDALWRDRAFFRLPDAPKAHLIGLFALAARLDNRIPDDPEWLAHELCASEPIDLGALVASGFLIPEHQASGAVAAGKHPAPASVSGSDLISGQGNLPFKDPAAPVCGAENDSAGDSAPSESDNGSIDTLREVEPLGDRRRLKAAAANWPAGFALDDEMRRFAAALEIDPEREFEAWRDDCAAHDRRYANWRAAWRSRCRNALRFAGRNAARVRASPAESAMDAALRRLREASEREEAGDTS